MSLDSSDRRARTAAFAVRDDPRFAELLYNRPRAVLAPYGVALLRAYIEQTGKRIFPQHAEALAGRWVLEGPPQQV